MTLTKLPEFATDGHEANPTTADVNAVIDEVNVISGRLVLGEFAEGDTVGTVVGGIEVFTADGETSLGYIAIYDAITTA